MEITIKTKEVEYIPCFWLKDWVKSNHFIWSDNK